MLESIVQDLRYAIRTMRKTPIFLLTTVLTLALAIGGNAVMFTVVRAVLLKPLQYPNSDQLVRISGGATPTRFAEMSAAAHSFAGLGAYTSQETVTLAGASDPVALTGIHVSAGFLGILGIDPILGRGFRPQEDLPGRTSVAMISAQLWQRQFGGDPQIIGRNVSLAATPYTIIGVLPARFEFPSPGVDVWMAAPSEWPLIPPASRALSPFLTVFGRLKSGVTLDQANAEIQVIHRQYATAHPAMLDAKPKTRVELTVLKEQLVANVRSMLWILFGAVGFVLMIACANVANLLITRSTFRAREFALRGALGAARHRLVRQLLTESILLSVFGGALGLLLAAFLLRVLPNITALELPRASEIHIDWVVLGFAAALSVITGTIFGLTPSLGVSRPDLMRVLRASGEGVPKGASERNLAGINLRSLLSIGQVALCIVLLIGAALLFESVAHLRGVEIGFNPANLLTVSISLPPLRYDTDQKKALFFDELVRRLGSLPGVRGATVAMTLPMMEYPGIPVQDAAKPQLRLNERLIAKFFPVTPGYFRTLNIPLKHGRFFTERNTGESERVAIIDESLARRFWPGYPRQDPVGQRLLVGGVNPKPAEIVGVVGDVNQNLDSRENWQESVYVSFAQNPQASALVAVRTPGDPLSFTQAVRKQVATLDRDQPLGAVQTMENRVEAQVGQRRLLVLVLGSFSCVALLLALIGIYGVIAYSVAQRTQELGIRRALGAQQSDILRLVLGQGVVLALIGIVVGLGAATALTRVMNALLFHVSATDPATFLGIALLFLVVALAASYLPARRAIRMDAIAALRV